MRNKFLPTRSRKQLVRRNGGWVCYIRDFYDTVVVTVTGDTRDEARDKGSEAMKQYLAHIKEMVAHANLPTGSWRNRRFGAGFSTPALAVMTFLNIMLDTVRDSLLGVASCKLVYISPPRLPASGRLALAGRPWTRCNTRFNPLN